MVKNIFGINQIFFIIGFNGEIQQSMFILSSRHAGGKSQAEMESRIDSVQEIFHRTMAVQSKPVGKGLFAVRSDDRHGSFPVIAVRHVSVGERFVTVQMSIEIGQLRKP